jgi:lia operon protein LiaG
VRSTSGDVDIVGITGPTTLQTTSGSVRVDDVAGDVGINSTSGDVRVGLPPEPSARIDVGTTSGTIRTPGLTISGERRQEHNLTGTVGSGDNRIDVRTTSGDVTLTR